MSTLAQPTRRTLPAPAPVDLEELRVERERLRVENILLRERLQETESNAREALRLAEEVQRLRREVAELKERAHSSRPGIVVPPPSRVPAPLPASLDAPVYAPFDVPGGHATDLPPSGGGVDFGTVSRLGPEELDALPYGLICLDAQGRVVHYNDTESRLARLPKERVIGRSFFGEVAPCTRVREFEGQFHDLVRDPSRIRVRSFDFVFRFRHSEQHVTIVLTPARTRGLYNMALLRRKVVDR